MTHRIVQRLWGFRCVAGISLSRRATRLCAHLACNAGCPTRQIVIVCVATACWLTVGTNALRAESVRGPFPQNLNRDAVTSCWTYREPSRAEALLDGARQALAIEKRNRQELRLFGLEAGRRYVYTVRLDDDSKAGGSFMTSPPPRMPFEFIAWGDSRSTPEVCRRIPDRIAATGVERAIHTGDFVGAGRDLMQWDPQFFQPCRQMLRVVTPFAAILGRAGDSSQLRLAMRNPIPSPLRAEVDLTDGRPGARRSTCRGWELRFCSMRATTKLAAGSTSCTSTALRRSPARPPADVCPSMPTAPISS